MPNCSLAGEPTNPASLSDPLPVTVRRASHRTHRESDFVERQKTLDRSVGKRNMMIGGCWFAGGSLFSAINYAAADDDSGGGRYYVAIGAIVFGAAQFFKGLAQTVR